jgi:hypothetical protein
MSSGGSQKATRVLDKMLSFMEKSRTDDMQEQDTLDSFKEMNENMREDRHKEVMDVFIEATKVKRKAMKHMAKEAKKRPAREKAETKKERAPSKTETKKEVPPAKTEAPPAKTEAPVTTKPVQTTPSTVPAPSTATPKLPTVSSAVTEAAKTAAKTVTGGAAKTAVKVGAGVAGISVAAALSIERETGKSAKDAITKVGQIVPNDPKPGVSSYGVFGINSGGSVQSFVKDNPQFELSAKPASKEFDEQWSKISKERPQEMLEAQLKWFDKNITIPVKNDLNKILPTQFANDPRILTYMSDRRVQYGGVMESQALKQASSAKSVEEFLSLMSQYDLANLKTAFRTYLSTHPNAIKGLETRIREREKASLKVVENDSNLGEKLSSDSTQNTDMKKNMSQGSAGGSPVIIQNNNTTQAKTNIHRAAPKEELNPTMR